VCASGTFQSAAPTQSSDRVCSNCDGSTNFQPLSNQTLCLPLTTCASSQFQSVAPTASSDRNCSSCGTCGDSQFVSANCTSTANTVCTNCTVCTSGNFELRPCTSSTNRICSACVQDCLSCPLNTCDQCRSTTYLLPSDSGNVLCVGNCSAYAGFVTEGNSCVGKAEVHTFLD
jgi:hypothetical protein